MTRYQQKRNGQNNAPDYGIQVCIKRIRYSVEPKKFLLGMVIGLNWAFTYRLKRVSMGNYGAISQTVSVQKQNAISQHPHE